MTVDRLRFLVLLLVVCTAAGCGRAQPPPPRDDVLLRRTAPLGIARAVHTATALPGGRVLLAGGCVIDGCGTATATTEVYDARARRFVPGPPLSEPRDGHTATRLRDGTILMVGGWSGEGQPPLTSAELCDPDAERCRRTGALRVARGAPIAVRLRDGGVLVIGGTGAAGPLASTERYDPGCRCFRPGPRLQHARAAHTATVLDDGRVLVAGGYGPDGRAVGRAEVLDLAAGRSRATGTLAQARGKHAAVALPGGRVLLIGGSATDETRERLASTELYSPRSGRFVAGPALRRGRYKLPESAVLVDGRVLVAADGDGVEVLDLRRRRTAIASPRTTLTAFTTVTPLGSGRALVAGGYDDQIAVTAAAFELDVRLG